MGMPSDWISYLDSSYRWNVQPGGTITYSFYETGSTLYGSTPTGISELPDAVKDNIRGIMSAMERFINIDFVEVTDNSSTYGTIRFMNDTGTSYAYAYYPSAWGSGAAGDVHLNPGYNNTSSNGWASAPGNHGYQAIWHEVGHALGLKHPFEGSVQAPAGLDNFNFTTMTYNFTGGEPTSWMPGDIYVLQQIYGANTSWAAGNTVYTFSQTDAFTDGTASYGTASLNALAVIWDGGGSDTLDLSAVSTSGLRIDLTPGTGIVTNASTNNTTSYSDNWGTKEAGTFYLTSTGSFIAYNVTIENAVGSAANDTMIGNADENVLDGRGGADQMSGGAGDDTYVVDNAGDVVIETASAGHDQVYAGVSYVLPNNVEELFLSAFPGIPGVVGASGSGTDPAINGTGNSLDNLLYGNSAANVLDGGAGADTMSGGGGDDDYYVDNVGDVVQENAGAGSDRVNASVSYTLPSNVEDLYLTGTAAINGTGNGLNNVIYGNDGNNVIDGKGGADTMAGGNGDDIYYVDDMGDIVQELGNGGFDRILSAVSYTLPAHIEVLRLLGSSNIDGTGNAADNIIFANAGSNTINGAGGNDVIDYRFASSGVTVSLAVMTAQNTGGSGTDTLLNIESVNGSAFDDRITGNNLANALNGGDGNDGVDGGLGADMMAGGNGDDIFVFRTALSAGNVDRITDFSVANDTIHLDDAVFSTLVAGTLSREAFFIGTGAADGLDRIIYNDSTGALYYDMDGIGATSAIQFATVGTGLAMTAADFVVV